MEKRTAAEESENKNVGLQVLLEPFYLRAAEAADRLSKLEISIASKKDAGDQEVSETVTELQSKLKEAESARMAERVEAEGRLQALATENAKLKYRITHLVRALEQADEKLVNKQMTS